MFKILRGFWFGSKTKILLSLIVCQILEKHGLEKPISFVKNSLAQKGHAS